MGFCSGITRIGMLMMRAPALSAWRGVEFQISLQKVGARLDVFPAITTALPKQVGIETRSIVLYQECDFFFVACERNGDTRGVGILQNIIDPLLSDAIDGNLLKVCEPFVYAKSVDINMELAGVVYPRGEFLKRGYYALLDERLGHEVEADAFEFFVHFL